jgi:hypothetical protein
MQGTYGQIRGAYRTPKIKISLREVISDILKKFRSLSFRTSNGRGIFPFCRHSAHWISSVIEKLFPE